MHVEDGKNDSPPFGSAYGFGAVWFLFHLATIASQPATVSGVNVAESCLNTSVCRVLILKALWKRFENNIPKKLKISAWNKLESKIHTKTNNLTKIPAVPVIIQCIMACCWTHFPHTGSQWVCTRPRRLNVFTDCSSNPLHVAHVEIIPTRIAVSIDVPSWDPHVNMSCVWDLHVQWEFFHAFSEIFGPLTYNVIREDNAEECYAD